MRILAPIDGIVIRRDVEVGEVVSSGLSSYSGGTMLFEIGDPSQLIVRGDIAEIDIGRVEIDQDVDIIVDAYPDTTYRGRVRWIAPVGQQKQGSTIVTFERRSRLPTTRRACARACPATLTFSCAARQRGVPAGRAGAGGFDDEDKEDERGEGMRGRFVAYVAQSLDSLATALDSTRSDSTRPDSALHLPLSAFSEVELAIGIETSTRLEILSGLASGDRVAEDPSLIRSKLEGEDEEEDEEQ